MDLYYYIRYLHLHYVEILGTITGLIYVLYAIERKRVLWIYGAISSLFYIYVFWQAGLKAYMILYAYYVGAGIYGWFSWNSQPKGKQKEISRLDAGRWRIIVFFSVVLYFIIIGLLKIYNNSDIPWVDGLLTSLSIVATWLLLCKNIDNWLLWIAVDLLSAMVSAYKGLVFTTILFAVYVLLAIKGYYEWKKEIPVKASR
jgi:nicotinamide mononucleotide transporter